MTATELGAAIAGGMSLALIARESVRWVISRVRESRSAAELAHEYAKQAQRDAFNATSQLRSIDRRAEQIDDFEGRLAKLEGTVEQHTTRLSLESER